MQASISLSISSPSPTTLFRSDCSPSTISSSISLATPRSLRFCGLRREATFGTNLSFGLTSSKLKQRSYLSNFKVSASLSNGTPSKGFDYDLVIIGAGVGGHGAALHAVEKVKMLISVDLILYFLLSLAFV